MSVLTTVQIANLALDHIRAGSIESFTEASVEARAIKLWFDTCRREVLERHDWAFARKRLALATHSEDPPEGVWSFRYQHPTDCISMRRLRNPAGEQADPVPFAEEAATDGTRSILTNLDDAIGVYTYDCTNPLVYTPSFVVAFSHCLAWRTAFRITGKRSVAEEQANIYNVTFRLAAAQNANAAASEPPRDAAWIRAR